MPKYTDKQLYEFVYRATDQQKIRIAERWLTEHKDLMARATYDDLIMILNRTAKRLFRAQMSEYEQRIFKQNFDINVVTGELVPRSEGVTL